MCAAGLLWEGKWPYGDGRGYGDSCYRYSASSQGMGLPLEPPAEPRFCAEGSSPTRDAGWMQTLGIWQLPRRVPLAISTARWVAVGGRKA